MAASFALFLGLPVLAIFALVGTPLFLVLRGTRAFKLTYALVAGACLGALSSGVFGGFSWSVSGWFAVAGVVATGVCWGVLHVRAFAGSRTEDSENAF